MIEVQREKCQQYGAGFRPCDCSYKIGISESALQGQLPLNGLRQFPESGTTGWFIWGGEWSDDPDFFKPLHLYHLDRLCSDASPFVALPPGWRFLVAPGYEDVWFDSTLLDT
jgi:hypothetical protein